MSKTINHRNQPSVKAGQLHFTDLPRPSSRGAFGLRPPVARHRIHWRCGFGGALLLAGGCLIERPEGEPFEDLTLVFSEPVCARPEQRLSSSMVLPDTVFGRITHLDLHSDAFTVVDALGKFTAVISYDLDVLQVVGRPGQGPGELIRPVAARGDDHRILVMDQATRRISAYHRAPNKDDVGTSQAGVAESIADLRRGPSATMGTDFVVLENYGIGIPVHEGPTYLLATAGPTGELISDIGPVHRDEASEKQLLRMFDRVAISGDGLVVWDDDEAMLILAANEREKRWRLPDPYRGTDQPNTSRAPDGRGIAISLRQPSMIGWTVDQRSVCMVVRSFGVRRGTDLLWLTWDGKAASPPALRSIETRGHEEPVSCGLVDDRLLVVSETEVIMFRLDESEPCGGE